MPAEGGTVLVRLAGVTKRHGGRAVLDDVTLDVRAGELLAVVGPSGAGKTTLLNVLLAWDEPDAGTVARAPVVRPGADGLVAWRSVAVVPQLRGLLDDLTLAENVELPLRLAGAADRSPAAGLIDRLGLAHLGGRRPDQVSLGEQQRAAVARALVLRPALVLADEPTAHQDRASADLVLAALRDAVDGGAGCVMVTHDDAAVQVADAVVSAVRGRLRPAGTTTQGAVPPP